MSDLPGDLVEEILCRVPATSINRLLYTCKGWNSLFNKKRFIRKHMDKAAKQSLVLMSLKRNRVCLMSVNFYGMPSVEVEDEYSLVDPQASLDAFEIYHVSHCDGLLLCNNRERNRIVVWNPCTGQTKWIRIQPRKIGYYFLGSYQDNKYVDNSYKILCCRGKIEIYEINSSLWRTLDVTLDCELEDVSLGMSLKGKTYWCASDYQKTYQDDSAMFLVSFDYTTERFERLLLPCDCPYYHKILSLSVVRDEKLSVLLKLEDTPTIDIWVTNKIDESTKVVSWSKVFKVGVDPPDELCIYSRISFLVVDEEKGFLLYNLMSVTHGVPIVIVGEADIADQVLSTCTSACQLLFSYVPSLTEIQQYSEVPGREDV